MTSTARDLVTRVIPHVPVRQWVFSLPFALRVRLAFDVQPTLYGPGSSLQLTVNSQTAPPLVVCVPSKSPRVWIAS